MSPCILLPICESEVIATGERVRLRLPGANSPDPNDEDEGDNPDRADEHDRKPIPLMMGCSGLPTSLHPAAEVFGVAGQPDPDGTGRSAGRFIIRAERRQSRIENGVLVSGPAAVDIALQHRRGGPIRRRRRFDGLDSMSGRNIRTAGQIPLHHILVSIPDIIVRVRMLPYEPA